MTKVFSHAGVSRLNGVIKARFANDALRVKVLTKGGHTDVDLVEFLEPLGKIEAVIKLIEMDFAKGNPEVQAALDAELDKRIDTPKPARVAKTVTAKTAKPITIESIKAKVVPTKSAPKSTKTKAQIEAEMEDAPF